MIDLKAQLWVKKYRPTSIDDIICRPEIRRQLNSFIKEGQIPNLIFSGKSGNGKTTTARVLANQLGAERITINASLNRNIETVRTTMVQFASTKSLTSDVHKVIILDEGDHMNAESSQPALRRLIEEFSDNCRFIFTCNHPEKLIEPLHSRCVEFSFLSVHDRDLLIKETTKRMLYILEQEKVEFDLQTVVQYIVKMFPDIRRMINFLQANVQNLLKPEFGREEKYSEHLDVLINGIRSNEFKDIRYAVGLFNNDMFQEFYRELYEKIRRSIDILVPDESKQSAAMSAVIAIIAEYSYREAFVNDIELNQLSACCDIGRTLEAINEE